MYSSDNPYLGYGTHMADPRLPFPQYSTGLEDQHNNFPPPSQIYNPGFGQEQFQAFSNSYNVIQVFLIHQSIWLEFSECPNEMMVLNQGRELFPTLDYKVQGLNPIGNYRMGLKLVRTSSFFLKYNKTKKNLPLGWSNSNLSSEGCDEYSNELLSEVKRGDDWMRSEIHWERLKIFNIGQEKKTGQKPKDQMTEEELRKVEEHEMMQKAVMLKVTSHQKYLPVLTVYEEMPNGMRKPMGSFSFPETEFIVVTSYKNNKIRILKTKNNKFVRGDVKRNADRMASEILQNPSFPSPTTSDSANNSTSSSSSASSEAPPKDNPNNSIISPLSKSLFSHAPSDVFQNSYVFSSESSSQNIFKFPFPKNGPSSSSSDGSFVPDYSFINTYLKFDEI